MAKSKFTNKITSFVAVFLAVVMLLGAFPLMSVNVSAADVSVSGTETKKPSIQLIDDGLRVDYSEYIDSSVMFRLPEAIKEDDEISVIITVDVPDLMTKYEGSDKTMSFKEYAAFGDTAEKTSAKIDREKNRILKELERKGIDYTLGEDYNTVLSGFEILIKASDFRATCQSLSSGDNAIISEKYNMCETELVENTVNVFDTGIFDSSDSKFDGSGMVVAVLDTGLDSNHTAFSVDNFTSDNLGLTYEDVAKVIGDTTASTLVSGITVDDVYINEKVPYGFDYADKDTDPYSTHNEHGTHVAGVIVGNDDTIRGVAPNAQVIAMKIFSDVEDSAMASWILSALEDCVVLGVDVINMSIGTACGFSRETDEEALNGVYDKIREAGISMVVAASNSFSSAYGSEANGNLGLTSNPDTGTVGSPSTYEGVMSVASISGTETPYIKYGDTIIYFLESTNSAAEENKFVENLLGDKDKVKMEYVVIPGVGRSADYTGMDVKGKLVLVRRGSNTFEEKAKIAQQQGAAGIIIYNNVSGDIKMNVGDATLAVCSISQNDGEMLAAKGGGKLTISKDQTSGPFISDFSSWGPTPSLEIKPEITAHGGNILSSVTGGSYDRLSGTSMACPNLAGVIILLRQYVVETFPDIADDNTKVGAMVHSLLMSTADIALGKNGLPYAVRKQGAGLANLASATATPAYIETFDENGDLMDKAKIELGDDPKKSGVYELNFTIKNFGDKKLTYKLGSYVMTEGVSETKTNSGKTTVTEESYLLDGAKTEILSVEGGSVKGKKITVGAGKEAAVTVKITLSKEDKKYLDKSFENGMYVEGFITLKAEKGTDIDLSVPYLAFYGDWTKAPLLDLEYYDTNADELDDGIDPEDKTMADAYATRPIGGLYDDYVSYLGSYYFLQDPDDMVIAANKDYIALSNQDGTVHSLRFVWAGLLRNAAKIEIVITDDTTGEVIFETEDTDVRKSYGDGGASIYPSNVEIEFDTKDYNLKNNSEYTVTLTGYLDYGEDGGIDTNKKNVFQFPFAIDFEAPTVTDVEYYYDYDKSLKKNRLYAKVAIYDNQYAMSSQLGYIIQGEDEEGNPSPEMKAFEQYLTPVYSQKNSTTYVTYELTDYIYKIKDEAVNKNTFVLTCYDYAMNLATYEIDLPTDYTDFYFDAITEEGITLSPNEIYTIQPTVYPDDAGWAELLEFSSSKTSVARIVNNKIVAVNPGKAIIKVTDPATKESLTFNVTVLSEGDDGYRRFDKPVADIFTLDGFNTVKAYYILNNEDKELGDTGSINFFEGKYSLSMYPSETVLLNYTLNPYFPKDTVVEYQSSNEDIVKIDEFGNVTAVAEGFASVTVKVMMDSKSTFYSQSVSVEVKDPYITTGSSLTHYYGNGGLVTIPDDLGLTEIGNFAFSNFEYIMKTPEELLIDDRETSKAWFIGDNTITKVIVPEGVKKISAYAFANLTALEEVVLPSTLENIDYGAFFNCSSLKKITFSGENNLKIINQNSFEGCNLTGTLDLSSACMVADYAFAGNRELEKVVFSKNILSIGQYAFAGCKKLSEVTIDAPKVKYGNYAFTGCEALTSFYVNSAVLPEGMFYECRSLESVQIGPDVNDIAPFAFRDTKVSAIEIKKGNKAFKVQNADYVISADEKTLVAVAPSISGEFGADNIGGAAVERVAKGAFSGNRKITSITLKDVTSVGEYAFASNDSLTSVTLGSLTDIGEYAYFETSITQVPAFTKDTKIGRYAFAFTNITSVTVPDDTVIDEGVFSECASLETVTIGKNVTVGKYAFSMNKDNVFDIASIDIDGKKYFHYVFDSSLKNLTIGEGAVIMDNAFANCPSLESVTLGAGATIGYMAFYNDENLKSIDLSKAKSIGEYAFSGDVYYMCYDENMQIAAAGKDGMYMYTYHAPALESVALSSCESLGSHAFSYCRELKSVTFNDAITEIPEYTFAGCIALESADLSKIVTVGDYAFLEAALTKVSLPVAETIGEYAFVNNAVLSELSLNEQGCEIGEGAFSYCEKLVSVVNLNKVISFGDYCFAYAALTSADLTGAKNIGEQVFLKENFTPFKVTFGSDVETIDDNPFAMCIIEPFYTTKTETYNGVDYTEKVYTYEISPTVKVVDGSLYCKTNTGYELITYAGIDNIDAKIADDTVRVSTMAFAGSKVKMVTLPYTVASLGHKAFYGCTELECVVFQSYDAPILEEEFDSIYYENFEHIPGTGDYGTYTDYDGNEVPIVGQGIIPYYMWNITGGMYSNVFYGASFVDYVGYVDNKLTMVKPVNGVHYDTYIMNHYFDLAIEGFAAPDVVTVAAINAINAIPDKVNYGDREFVEAARLAYDKIATLEQQSLVKNYQELISAEQRISALAPVVEEEIEQEKEKEAYPWVAIIISLAALILISVLCMFFFAKDQFIALFSFVKKNNNEEKNSDEPRKEKKAKKEKKPVEKKPKKEKKAKKEAPKAEDAAEETQVEAPSEEIATSEEESEN